MAGHMKKHDIDNADDHGGATSATENGIVAFDANGLPKEPSTDIAVGQKLTGITTPTADGDAATKGYVDALAEGLAPKDSVRVASLVDITLSGEQTIDTVDIVVGDRVLVMTQDTAVEDGIYVASATAWARADDMAAGSSAAGAYTFIEEGTYADEGWVCSNDKGSDVVATDALTFTQFSGMGHVTAGTGLTKDGDTINAIGGDGITANADDLAVDLHDTNPGLEIDTTQLRVKADGAHGIVRGASGMEAELKANFGLSVDADGLAVDLVAAGAGTGGLELSGGDIQVKTDGDHGVILTSTGVEVEVEASKGLAVGASGLAIDPDSETGVTVAPIALCANGAGMTVDNVTIDHDTGTLRVKDAGVDKDSLNTDVAGAGLTGGAGSALSVDLTDTNKFLATSAGAGSSGCGIILDAGGHVDATMINDADVSHDDIADQRYTGAYAIHLRADITSDHAVPEQDEFGAWAVGDAGFGIGSDSSVWLVRKTASDAIKLVQLS